MDKQLLSDLYVLRAGLSQISIEKGKIDKEENSLNTLEKTDKDLNAQVSKLYQSKEGKEDWNLFQPKEITTRIEAKEIFIRICVGLFYGLGGALIHILMNFMTGLVSSGLEWVKKENIPEWWVNFIQFGNWPAVGICCAITAVILTIIFETIYIIKVKKAQNEEMRKIQNEKNRVAERNKEINRHNESIETEIFRKGAAQVGVRQMIASQKEVYESTAALLSVSSKGIYDTLVAKYKEMLDIRDWKYLDLIIFYFETGRADTLKEALQQVDRRVQANEIISAVRSASSSICSTINSSMSSLGGIIQTGFSNLSNQLAMQHQEQMGMLKEINTSIKANSKYLSDISAKVDNCNEYLKKINTSSELSNALLTKINVDSTRIWDDVDYMLYKAPRIANIQTSNKAKSNNKTA